MEETLLEVRDHLSRSGVVNSDLAIPLFDSLLRVALAEVSSCPDRPEEKPDRVSPALGEPVSVTYTFAYSQLISNTRHQDISCAASCQLLPVNLYLINCEHLPSKIIIVFLFIKTVDRNKSYHLLAVCKLCLVTIYSTLVYYGKI